MDVQEIWKKAANYDEMKVGQSVLLIYFGEDKYVASRDQYMDVANAKSGVIVTKNLLGPHFALVAKAGLINIHSNKTGIEAVDFDILNASAQAEISSTFIGAGANLELAGGSVSIFDLKLAAGVDTGIGIKDDSLTVEVLGTGLSVGRRLGVSVLGSEFAIDLVRVFALF